MEYELVVETRVFRSAAFAEAHANRPPKEMFRGASSLDVHEVFLSTDTE